ncbi:MAG: thioredoxin family protein [Desulfomonilia bacterium]|jgi:thioredoxin 1|nr:thioredoxin family protein [Desulfomonilia bacterium]HPW68815.1 thioredoxin family protein [Deltaproteobacteria bacterium]
MANCAQIPYDNQYRAGGGILKELKEIDETNFAEFLRHQVSVLIFSSPWCTSCKKISTSLEGLLHKREDRFCLGVCDIGTSPSIPSRMQVFSVPTVIIFRDGREVGRLQGPLSETAVAKALEAHL